MNQKALAHLLVAAVLVLVLAHLLVVAAVLVPALAHLLVASHLVVAAVVAVVVATFGGGSAPLPRSALAALGAVVGPKVPPGEQRSERKQKTQ